MACAGVVAMATLYVLAGTGRAGEAPGAVVSSAAPAPTLRDLAFQRARTRVSDAHSAALTEPPPDPAGTLSGERVTCRFVPESPSGTSPKFDCELSDGEVVKVKYGHEPEINAEVAASRLLTALGYAADRMYMVPRLRCYGCPGNPFLVMRLLDLLPSRVGRVLLDPADSEDYADFEWVAVERKFDAATIENDDQQGWSWWELKRAKTPVEELDALRLIAVFLAHWDNKAVNQRLVCMDPGAAAPSRGAGQPCADPLLMMHDVGATFGPMKMNAAQWNAIPIWSDPAACVASMRLLPYRGSTFPDAKIHEAARLRVGHDLASFTDADLRAWLKAARFPEFYTATGDEKDLEMWMRVFRHRVDQILSAGPCPQ